MLMVGVAGMYEYSMYFKIFLRKGIAYKLLFKTVHFWNSGDSSAGDHVEIGIGIEAKFIFKIS